MAVSPNRTLVSVPTLDEVAANPGMARSLPSSTRSALIVQAAAVIAALSAAVLISDSGNSDDRLLTVEEAAPILAVATDWLYRHGKRLGLAVKLGDGTLRFSSAAIQKAIAENRLSPAAGRRRKGRTHSAADDLTNSLS
jgi:predicted DNA-binding transcriptional regulator AlpA